MRHALSTSGRGFERECPGAVGGVGRFVAEDAEVQAVPEDLEPAVGELAQYGVVGVAGGDLGVVDLLNEVPCRAILHWCSGSQALSPDVSSARPVLPS